jgi:Winged helix DNA-binding domain
MAGPILTSEQLARATLARQLLLERRPTPVKRAVARLAGVNAQGVEQPYLSLLARVDGFQPGAVVRLLRRREVVRATSLRGTLHLHTADDLLAWRTALAPVIERAARNDNARDFKKLDLEGLLEAARRLLDERPRTRAEWIEELAPFAEQAQRKDSIGLVVRAFLPLVQLPPAGEWGSVEAPAYQLAESWLRRPLGPAGAGRESLVLRYLAAFGPATWKDVQYWSGLTGLREVLEKLQPRLRILHDTVGREYFDVPRAPLPDATTKAPPRLLPAFDNLLYAHDDRSRLIETDAPYDRRRGANAFLLDGRVAGTWTVERDRLALRPFDTIPRNQRAPLRAEAERVLTFLAHETITVDLP